MELTDDFGILVRVNSPAPVTLERSEGISGCYSPVPVTLEEREDIIVLTLLNPPVPVTLGDLEQRDKIVSFDKKKSLC